MTALLGALGVVAQGCTARATEQPGDLPAGSATASSGIVIRVMTFNLWHGGEAGGEPLERTVDVIRAARADIVGLQETHGLERDGAREDHAPLIAAALGWHAAPQGGRTAIISRFPVVSMTPQRWGCAVELDDGRRLLVFNVHLAASPYQPYQLLGIPYHDAPFLSTPAALIDAARSARGGDVSRLLDEVGVALTCGVPVVVTGDFNEPSHLDWSPRAAEAGAAPAAVAYPTSRALIDAGLRDAWRVIHPCEVGAPGWTWTPTTAEDDPTDRHDRIDFVYVGSDVQLIDCAIVGERPDRAEIVVTPYPSDHRGVVATLRLPRRGSG
ncbi:MAG TPA: endonuclease/exonuclease/phosphatase family protein [Phycisphaerales bacterium]|nr:endonuclease/exonuclease/phosphatase family protein [Phycisphaerales bacterium]HMP37714.1 endonuclease/exonuclease/phosphatase family protein [Phycisphaerales bacterium]